MAQHLLAITGKVQVIRFEAYWRFAWTVSVFTATCVYLRHDFRSGPPVLATELFREEPSTKKDFIEKLRSR
jgi:hypothetical protein